MYKGKVYDMLLLIDSPDGRKHTTGGINFDVEHFHFRFDIIHFQFQTLLRNVFFEGNDWKMLFMCVCICVCVIWKFIRFCQVLVI